MRINPTTQTIGNFFNNTTEQFFVPAYQRRYAWGISQLDALFNDVNLLEDGDTHLLGTVVLLAETHSAGINRLELVDGQQRITTLCILLKVLQDNFKNTKNSDEIREIKKYLGCRSGDSNEQKIMLGDLDYSDFIKIMNGKADDLENKRLKQAFDSFNFKIKDDGFNINNFYRKLTDQVEIIRLDIGQAKDAYKLFETINNRGLKLSAADIVKNFLLGHASILNSDISDVLKDVKENWRQLIINLDELGYSDMDKFFRQYLMGKIKLKVPSSRLIEEFKNYYYLNIKESEKLSDYQARIELIGKKRNRHQENNGVDGDEDSGDEDMAKFNLDSYQQKKLGIVFFAKELQKCSAIYKNLVLGVNEDADISRKLKGLKSIEAIPSYTFLMNLVFSGVEKEEYLKILDLVECFILRRQVCEYRTGELDDIFPKLCRLSKKDLVENIKKELFDHLPDDKEFKKKFPSFSNKGSEERAKYILRKIEYKIGNNSKEIDIRGGREVHLEHIIPQTIVGKKAREYQGGDWVGYLGSNKDKVKELHKKYINRMGNLTILGESLNIKASNNPFRSKTEEYKKSVLLLNKDLVDNYKKFKFPQVDQRGTKLSEIAVKIWKF
ncbi:DUF262 domain-containing HNH endonuclease family protein [Patescibacteria group bacterium]|nr:DUF262 domain-containing HNH endonuclease family protein [Patescibacteria group bacterium]MBU1922535.1 DUF262 domain-containing HNH endonuclease family protein [Patescibacteria group bacterium]